MQSPMMEDNIAGDTSRSPIPIDPELNRHMMRQLPPNVDNISNSHKGNGSTPKYQPCASGDDLKSQKSN